MRPLLLLLLIVFCAFSQPPLRRVGASTGDSNVKKTEGTTKTGNAEAPIPPGASEINNASGQRKQTDSDAEQNRRIADYTAELVTYTKALVFVGIIQAAIFIGHFVIFRRTLDAARSATTEEARLTQESNATTRAATELTRQSFILANRPKVVVRNISVDQAARLIRPGNTPNPSTDPFSGRLRTVNAGGTPAYITGLRCTVWVTDDFLPLEYPLSPFEGALANEIRLPPGVFGTLSFPTERGEPTDYTQQSSIAVGGLSLYVLGWITYRDDLRNVRTTYFCRRWDRARQRFEPVENPDYENAD